LAWAPLWREGGRKLKPTEPDQGPWSPLTLMALAPLFLTGIDALRIDLAKFFLQNDVVYLGIIFDDLSRFFSLNFISLCFLFISSVLYLSYYKPTIFTKTLLFAILFSLIIHSSSLLEKISDREFNRHILFFIPILIYTITLKICKKINFGFIKPYYKISYYCVVIIIFSYITILIFSFTKRTIPPFFYELPILNVIDGLQIIFIFTLYLALRISESSKVIKISSYYIVPFLAFIWLNSLSLRIAYKYFGEFVHFGDITHYPYFNGSLALIWGVTAFLIIFMSQRIKNRKHWLMGAGLLALDVIKLFIVDLRNSPTFIRITAFLLIGLLLTLIGWLAPLPPKSDPGPSPDQTPDSAPKEADGSPDGSAAATEGLEGS
jgi:hypothetical protein